MHNRVDVLEQKVQELTVGLSEVRQQQSDTEKQIVNLSEKQDQGFQQLLAAIAGLKQDSTPTRSPPHKAARNA
jgi:flagellar biosynthesis chaperone FliJ